MRLILGDDQAIFLDALSTVLTQRGYEVGAVARSSDEMIAYVHHQRPDACLIDCNLGVGDGIQTIQRVIEASDTTTVVVLGSDADSESAELAIDAGASGYLHQSRPVDVLVSALERMTSGERVVDLPDTGPARRPRRASHADTVAATLTGRERECLSLLVAGLDTAAIVAAMGVSRTTVRTHLQAVLAKLGVHSRLEAASFAVRHHLVDAWAEPGAGAPAVQASLSRTPSAPSRAAAANGQSARATRAASNGQSARARSVASGQSSGPNRAASSGPPGPSRATASPRPRQPLPLTGGPVGSARAASGCQSGHPGVGPAAQTDLAAAAGGGSRGGSRGRYRPPRPLTGGPVGPARAASSGQSGQPGVGSAGQAGPARTAGGGPRGRSRPPLGPGWSRPRLALVGPVSGWQPSAIRPADADPRPAPGRPPGPGWPQVTRLAASS